MSDLLQRRGTFEVSRDLIRSNPEGVLKALEGVLIVHIDDNFVRNGIVYSGFSEYFDITEDNGIGPKYQAVISATDDDVTVKWVREDLYNENDIKIMLAEIKGSIRDIGKKE
jgi:hypothetical protein